MKANSRWTSLETITISRVMILMGARYVIDLATPGGSSRPMLAL